MIQLRIKTEYTFGRTFCPINRTIERLKAIGCTAAGIVDQDSAWGHVPWFNACTAAGIQPMLGIDLVVADDDVTKRMWFLARSTAGLSELYQAASQAFQQPIISKVGRTPRLYTVDVQTMSDQIFKFAGDITDKDFLSGIGAYADLNPSSRILNNAKLNLGLPLVETSDNVYAFPEDVTVFEFASRGRTKPTPQHILELLGHQDEAIAIAEQCKGLTFPQVTMLRATGDLEALCREGIAYRKLRWTAQYEERLMYELELIRSKDFESYFLIVADMVIYAKQHMLVGPSRGSAAGSLVCFLARITEIDPIPAKLFFERFIDVSRTDLPDIDLDFPDEKREIVFDYMGSKYGSNNVAHIGTINQFKPRSALIQVCKALNIPKQATVAIKIAMIERSSADARATNCLQDTFETTDAGKTFIKMYPEVKIASQLEGHASHTGKHAAGLLVCNDEISKYAVVNADNIAQIAYRSLEKIGLLKIDILGLRTLSILEDSGVPLDWYNIPLDDPAMLDVFNNNRLCGIFQFEGDAMRQIAGLIKFRSINEVDAVTALARPGPFAGGVTRKYIERFNGEPYEAIHPLVERHMADTFGLPIYQEQTLSIVREIGKFGWKEAYIIRRAMSKSLGVEFFNKYWEQFKVGATSQGIDEMAARQIWEMINTMGSWQMNHSHTYSYAVVSAWCAFLKAHHPLEFAASTLRHAKDEDSAIQLLREMANEGIEYIPFDINLSEENWTVKDGLLVGGFNSLKGVGDIKATTLVEKRNAGTLTTKEIETINSADNVFKDIFPMRTRFGHMYADPEGNNISGDLDYIKNIPEGIPHGHERVFLGELIYKNPRNLNEEVLIKKREGKIATGQLEYLELRFRDDTGQIGGRISARDYLRIGKPLLDIPTGAVLLVRAKFWNGFRYAFITKWKQL